ncbi:hypothetical protein JCM3765_005765 [Sporobolomyces pararoseus]
MSETDKEVSPQILSSLASLSLEEHSDSSKRSPITLQTLPNELLSAIFLHLDDFILPPLSKRLLPFHRAQLYRAITLNLSSYDSFKSALESNSVLPSFVETVVLNFDSLHNYSPPNDTVISRRASVDKLFASMPKLRTVALNVHPQQAIAHYPSKLDFDKNPRLEKFLVGSCYDGEEESSRKHHSIVLDWSILTSYTPVNTFTEGKVLYEDQVEPEVVLELEKQSDATYKLRYFTAESTEIDVHKVLRETPISKIQFVVFTHQIHLDRLLSNLGTPSLLTHLCLFSYDDTITNTPRQSDFLSRFPNLSLLALGGTSLPDSLDFYDSLSSFSLESLHLGPKTSAEIQPLIDLISNASKSNLTPFKRLILDNIDAHEPSEEDEEDATTEDWILPEWTRDCSEEKVRELRELAKKLGIETDETTFKGLDIVQSAAYQAALKREEEGSEDEEEEEEEEEEEDEEDYRESYEGDSDDEDYEELHEEICGCHRDYDWCWTFADYMGWPRRRGRNSWY